MSDVICPDNSCYEKNNKNGGEDGIIEAREEVDVSNGSKEHDLTPVKELKSKELFAVELNSDMDISTKMLSAVREDVKGYRLFNLRTKQVITSRDVIIMAKVRKSEIPVPVQETVRNNEENLNSVAEIPVKEDTVSEDDADDSDSTYVPSDYEDANSIERLHVERPTRVRRELNRYGWYACIGDNAFNDASGLSVQEALNGTEKEQWLKAIQEELQCFEDSCAWDLVDTPKNGTIVKCDTETWMITLTGVHRENVAIQKIQLPNYNN
ncbi:unnamed protein product, partial [Brenthis ino]